MNTLAQHAREIAEPLSQSLADLEIQSTPVAADAARRTIHGVWLTVVTDVESGRADLSSAYLGDVHRRLATAAGVQDAGGFREDGLPQSHGGPTPWTWFVRECRFDDEIDTSEEEYALAQLRWGGHVPTFALTLGWFAMNVLRLRRGEHAVYPPRADHGRFLQCLKDAGPDDYDAETGLRGLASAYAREQSPEADSRGTA